MGCSTVFSAGRCVLWDWEDRYMRNMRAINFLRRNAPVYLPALVLSMAEGLLFYFAAHAPDVRLPVLLPLFLVFLCVSVIDWRLYRYVSAQIRLHDQQLWDEIKRSMFWWGTAKGWYILTRLPREKPWARVLRRAMAVWLAAVPCAMLTLPLLLLCWAAGVS